MKKSVSACQELYGAGSFSKCCYIEDNHLTNCSKNICSRDVVQILTIKHVVRNMVEKKILNQKYRECVSQLVNESLFKNYRNAWSKGMKVHLNIIFNYQCKVKLFQWPFINHLLCKRNCSQRHKRSLNLKTYLEQRAKRLEINTCSFVNTINLLFLF